jgi:TldD protein
VIVLDERDLLAVLGRLLSSGADFAEAFIERTSRTSLVLDDGALDSASGGWDVGIGLRIVKGDRTFFANGNDVDLAAVLRLAGSLAASIEGTGRPAPSALSALAAPPLLAPEVPPRDVPLVRKTDLLTRADRTARAADPRIAQVVARYSDTVQEVRIATSDGRLADDTRTWSTLAVHALARQGDRMRTGYAVASETSGFELFTARPPETVAGEAARLALLQLDASPAPSGTFTVVLSSKAGGTMVHEACGHGLEGDFVEKGLSAYAGRLGQSVASPLVSVVDDGTLPHKRGTSRFDDEGIPASRVVLIERGVLRGFLHSRRSAERMGVAPTGNGRRESFRHLPIPRMRNTMILPGSTPPEAILTSVKDGIFVAHMGGGEVDIASGQFVFQCSEAYRIRDGKIAEPLQDVTLAGCGPDVLASIDQVGSDLGFQVGTCGKDGQGAPVSDAQPTLRIPALVVGGQAPPPGAGEPS